MSTAQRTDIHRPSVINPADYELVGFECIKIETIGDCYVAQEERAKIRAHMARTGGTYSKHVHGGNCGVCGNSNAIYTVLFHHEKTNVYIRMGQDCAQKADFAFGSEDFDAFKRNVGDARRNATGKAKALVLLEDEGIFGAFELYAEKSAEVRQNYSDEQYTVTEIVASIVKYGNITPRQVFGLKARMERIVNAEAIKAQREAEKALADPAPNGRTTVEGTVLSVKPKESQFGTVLKMFVKSDSGFTVYGTVPTSLVVKRGDTVRFTATFSPAEGDEKHAFFSRPTKAMNLTPVEVEPEIDPLSTDFGGYEEVGERDLVCF